MELKKTYYERLAQLPLTGTWLMWYNPHGLTTMTELTMRRLESLLAIPQDYPGVRNNYREYLKVLRARGCKLPVKLTAPKQKLRIALAQVHAEIQTARQIAKDYKNEKQDQLVTG